MVKSELSDWHNEFKSIVSQGKMKSQPPFSQDFNPLQISSIHILLGITYKSES